MIEFRELPKFGVTVSLNLRDDIASSHQAWLRTMLNQHGLILFREQFLTRERQVEVMAWFADCGNRRIKSDSISSEPCRGILGRDSIGFHSEFGYSAKMPSVLSLYAVDADELRPTTQWCDTRHALKRMGVEALAFWGKCQVLQVFERTQVQSVFKNEDLPRWRPRCRKPVVSHRPFSNTAYLTPSELHSLHVYNLRGEEFIEQEGFNLKMLMGQMYCDESVAEHAWHTGDFAIWDNYCVQHGRREITPNRHRTLQRALLFEET